MPIRYSIVWILLLFCALLLCSCSDNQPLVADHLKSTPEWKELINEVSSYQLCQAIAVQNKDELLFFQDQLKHFISINPAVVPEIVWVTPSDYVIKSAVISRPLVESLIKNNNSNTFHFENGSLKLLSLNSSMNKAKFMGDLHHFYKIEPTLADYILDNRPEKYINLQETYQELGLESENYKGILFLLDPKRGCFETTFLEHISSSKSLNSSGYVLLLAGNNSPENLQAIKANFKFGCKILAVPEKTGKTLKKLSHRIYDFPVNFILYNFNTNQFKESRYLSCDNAIESIYE